MSIEKMGMGTPEAPKGELKKFIEANEASIKERISQMSSEELLDLFVSVAQDGFFQASENFNVDTGNTWDDVDYPQMGELKHILAALLEK